MRDSNSKALPLCTLALFINVVFIFSLGRIDGALLPVARFTGGFLLLATAYGFYALFASVKKELPAVFFILGLIGFSVQIFWAFFKAPLDADGLFYHLTIMLEALQKNKWGNWDFLYWQVQDTPKFGELPNLALIAFGGRFGYRLCQFGHFSSVLLGALSLQSIARAVGHKTPSLFGLVFLMTPIVTKQMGANYVDVAQWCYVLAAFAFLCGEKIKNQNFVWAAFALFLHVGVKFNGFITAFALLPLLFYQRKNSSLKFGLGILTAFYIAACASWMIPNLMHHGNPFFPIQPLAVFDHSLGNVIPPQIDAGGDFRGVGKNSGLPHALLWIAQFFSFEPVAVYDMGSGAWGFIGLWAVVVLLRTMFKAKKFKFEFNLKNAFVLCLVFTFLLMPARFVPRHGLLGGWIFIFLALFHLDLKKRTLLTQVFTLCFVFQFLYLLPDRAVLRGVTGFSDLARVTSKNLRDIVRFGEPQSSGRWIHYPYVPALRKDEPRTVVVNDDSIDMTALFWGRTFSNKVVITNGFCRWPYCK